MFAKISLAGVEVSALVDTGASTSCCRWGWYERHQAQLGPLYQSDTVVFGIGNIPIKIKGLTHALQLRWDDVEGPCQFMVLETLEGVDMILGMDILERFQVQIDARERRAWPNLRENPGVALVLETNCKIPAGKSKIFFVKNAIEGLTLFEPDGRLPEGMIGVPTLSTGKRVAVQLDNLSKEDIILNPQWGIGKLYPVEIASKPSAGHLPDLSSTLAPA